MANWSNPRHDDDRYRDDDYFEQERRRRAREGYRSENTRPWDDDRRSEYGQWRERDRSEWTPERTPRSQFGSGRDQGGYLDREDRSMSYRDRESGTSRGGYYGQETPERESEENRYFGGGSLSYGRAYGSQTYGSHAPSSEGYMPEGYGSDAERGARGGQTPRGPHSGMGPKGYKRSDERIKEEVCERLTDNGYVDASNVEVEVLNCEVTLNGTVADRNQRHQSEHLAEQVSGVSHVQNNLRVQDQFNTTGMSGISSSSATAQQRSSFSS